MPEILDLLPLLRPDVIYERPLNFFKENFHLILRKIPTIWTLEKGYNSKVTTQIPYRCSRAQSYQFIMKINNEELNDLCHTLKSSFIIIFHLPNEIPTRFHQAESIRFDRELILKLSAKTSKANRELKRLKPEYRGCFFRGERTLKYFKTYTKTLCDLECLSNYSLSSCGCVHFSYPRTKHEKICDISEDECLLNAYYNWPELDKNSVGNIMPCNCLPICSEIEYIFKEKQVTELNEMSSMTIANIINNEGFVD